MPIFMLNTNVPASKIPPGFAANVTNTIARILSKPAERVMVIIRPGEDIICGGSDAPAAHAALHSIGQLSPEQNQSHSDVLAELFESTLGIPKNRLTIIYNDLVPSNVAWNGAIRG